MIRIDSVRGRCLIQDGFTSTTPAPGMTLQTAGSDKIYILMTGPEGSMTLTIDNDKITLGPDTVARFRGTRAPELAKRKGNWDQCRLFFGRIWARLKGPEPLESICNAAPGVRG